MSVSVRRALKISVGLILVGLSASLLAAVITNLAPAFDTKPYPVAELGQSYRYAAHANDPEGNTVRYSVAQGPAGMAFVDTEQAVTWSPTNAQLGTTQVTVRAQDSWGAAVDQTYTLRTVADYCEIYPITVPQSLVANVQPGQEFTLVPRGAGAGNFSWLSWDGATDAPTLAGSLMAPGNSYNYINPSNAADHLLEIGDWAQGSTGSMNAYPVREQMDLLKTRDIVIPTWDGTRAAGADFDYRVVRFAVVRLRQYDLSGPGALSFQFRGYKNCYNDAPVAANQTLTTPEDQSQPIVLRATDPENDALTYRLIQSPLHGHLDGTAPNLTYVPDANYNGPDAFTFRANDGEFDSNVATVAITVTPVNDPPTANNLQLQTNEDVALAVTLSGQDLENDALSYHVVDAPTHGALTGSGAALRYQPAPNYNGPDQFTYRVNDGALDSALATVQITVVPVNDAPTANDQAVQTDEDTPVTIHLTGADIDGDTVQFQIRQTTAHGTLVGSGADWHYTPNHNYFGPDEFTFVSNDGRLDSALATVHITVVEKNAPPVAQALNFEVAAGTPVEIVLTGSDPEGDDLSFRPVTTPSTGQLSGLAPTLSYVSDAGFSGTVSFTYVANDGRLDSTPATVTIVVTAANAPPRITSTPLKFFDERSDYSYDVDATDPDAGDVLTYSAERVLPGVMIDAGTGVLTAPSTPLLVGGVREKNLACRTPAPRSTFDPVLKWGRGDSATEEVRGVLGPALVAQLTDDNGDGQIDLHDQPDVVVSTRLGGTSPDATLIALSGDTGATLFAKHMDYLAVTGTAAIGDVDSDGKVDIAVLESKYAAHMSLLANDGTLKWRVAIPPHTVLDGWSRDAIAIADLDGDGSPELIRGATIVNGNGTVRCTGTGDKGGPSSYGYVSTVADLDSDGKQEIIAGRSIYDSQCHLIRQLNAPADGYTAIGNFDADDNAEIVLVSNGSSVGTGIYVFKADGTKLVGPIALPGGGTGGPPTLANVDNDPYPEIGVAGYSKYTLFDNTGAVLWANPTQDYSSAQTGSTFFDFEGDGFSEIVYGDEHNIYFWDGRTGALRYSFANPSDTTLEYPVIADLDGDGSAEVIAGFNDFNQGNGGGLRVIASSSGSWANARPLWNQHAFSLTNINDDGSIPAHPVPSWLAHNTYRLNQLSHGQSLGLADLALFDLRLDPADQKTIRLTALNRGLAATTSTTIVRIYDGVSAEGRLLGTVSLPVMAPEQSINVALNQVEAHALGDHLYATIDDVDAVAECDEINNAIQAQVFHLRATDRAGLFDQQVSTASVLDVNDAPSFKITTPGTPHIGHFFTHQLKASDPDIGDGLIYSLISGPTGMTIEPVSGELRWTPLATQAGTQTASVRVTDLRGLSADQTLSFGLPANHAPVVTSTALLTATATQEYWYDMTATDADGDILSYTLTTKPIGMLIDGATGVIRWTPTTTQIGTFSVTARVADPYGGAVTQSFKIVVKLPVNHAPVFDSSPLTVVALGQRYQYNAQASDPDGNPLSFALLAGPTGMAVDTVTGTIVWQPNTSQVGEHAVSLKVTDSFGASATQSFTVYVTQGIDAGNHPPAITSVPDTALLIDQTYTYQVAANDIDGDTLSYALPIAPTGMTLDTATGAISWTPTAAQTGLNAVSIVVSDGHGGTATQMFSILVTTVSTGSTGNRPPAITSDPLTQVMLGQTYRYYALATDPDADPLTFQLTQAPAGMTINASTGVIAWTPSALGTVNVTLLVSDGRGGQVTQSFTVTTIPVQNPINHLPLLLQAPANQAKVGQTYCDTLQVTDADGDALQFSLPAGPTGAAVDAAGKVCWTPTAVGTPSFTVRISDGKAYTDVTWTVTAVDANTPLTVNVVVSPTRVLPGTTYTVTEDIDGASGPVIVTAVLNGTPITLDTDGSTNLIAPTAPGYTHLTVTVTDGVDTVSDTADFFIADPADTTPPTVAITSPVADGKVTAPTAVQGQVLGADVVRWTLSLLDKSTGAMTPIASGTEATNSGVLGQLDPTMLTNGFYTLILQAWDAGGNQATDSRVVLIDGEMKLGQYSVSFEDVSIQMAGLSIRVTRTYDTRRRNERLDFGYGWSVDYQNLRLTESRTPGYSWSLLQERNGFFGNWCVRPNGDPIVAVTGPDGKLMKFRAKASPECQFLVPQTDVKLVFEPLPGTDAQLDQTDYQNVRLASVAGSGVYNLIDLADPYQAAANPSHYRLKLPDGTVYSVTQGTGLTKVAEPDGNTLTYTRDGVKHSLGQEVKFFRDGQGSINEILLPDGQRRHYTYTSTGDLEMAVDAGADITSFGYLARAPHYLNDIVDPRGVRVSRNEYDDNGRLVATIDADGHRIEYTHNLAGRTEKIKDRRGNASIYGYDEQGRVIAESNALGETTLHSYDDNGNELTTTDPLGHTTVRTFNARGNLLTETNALGEKVLHTYNDRSDELTQTDPLGRVTTTNSYNAYNGKLVVTKDALGNLTSFGYDSGVFSGGTGELLGMTDAANNQTKYVLDLWGHRAREIDPLGNITYIHVDFDGKVHGETRTRTRADGTRENLNTSYTLDAKNRIIATVHPDGSRTTTDYDGNDKAIKACDGLNRCAVQEYNARGELAKTTYSDGTFETTAYDENGNVVAQTDRGGHTTKMIYDAANRLVSTILPDATPNDDSDNARTGNEYDPAGRLTVTIDARGHRTTYGYDDAGRRRTVTDALGHVMTTAYNAAGQRTSITDALGRITRFNYDAAGRLTQTIFPDDTALEDDNPRTTTEYDAVGRKLAETDELGRRKTYAYDAVGRMIAVTLPNPATGQIDSGALVTRFVYDEVGNKTQQIDALGRVTRWEYEAIGRQTRRTLPGGQSESFAYDSAGQLLTHTDFNGRTAGYTYDNAGRLEGVDYASDPDVITTYTASGQRETVTDGQGTTTYRYTARDQLRSVQTPDGQVISYAYDAAGNRTELHSAALDQVFVYDELNRLSAMHSQTLGGAVRTVSYGYDEVGNRLLLVQANGATTTTLFDARNRLRQLATRTAAGVMLFGANYTVDATGARIGIAEYDNHGATRSVGYAYDADKRLLAEAIERLGQATRVTNYTYDAMGNRTRREANGVITTYQLDANDRLIHETEAGVDTLHTYDANGNTTGRAKIGEMVTFGYNEANRLVRTTNANGVAETGYNADGIRNRQTTGGQVTTWLIDPNRDYAQTLEAYRNNQLATVWQYGDALLAQTNVVSGSTFERNLQTDGLGSVRQATDAFGSVTDAFEYDAFGEELARSGSSDIDHRYRSEQVDPNTGFYNLRARWFDAGIGRFINQDDWRGKSNDPPSLHKYLYANADPVNRLDPSGRATLSELCTAVRVSVTNALAGVRTGFSASRAAGGAAFNNLGAAVENGIGQILRQVLGEGAVSPGARLVGPGGPRVIDFLLKLEGRLAYLEVKYGLPRVAGPALERLIGQILTGSAAAEAEGGTFVLFTWAAPSEAQMALMLEALGENPPLVKVISGIPELLTWARNFFLVAG